MVTQSIDTDPAVEAIQIKLLQQASFAKRFNIMSSLTQTTRQLSFRAIQRANPTLTKQELDLLFVAYHYGSELAERLRIYLEQRNDESS